MEVSNKFRTFIDFRENISEENIKLNLNYIHRIVYNVFSSFNNILCLRSTCGQYVT